MSQRSKTIDRLKDYFEEKGAILTYREYRKQKDTPIRPDQVKRIFGSWARMENIVRKLNIRNELKGPPASDVDQVIARRNEELAAHEEMIRAIGEDVDQKTAREAAARAHIEAEKLNAATPEGARENKVRKGGPEDWDARVKEESLQRAIAEEHAMLAKTPAGAALGKELLGGVEDQDAKNLAIATENARTERSALLAATPEGAALAKMEEDDSDGRLTREAEVRVRNELRPFVAPSKNEDIDEVFEDEKSKLTDESKEAVDLLKSDEDLSMPAAARAERARTISDAMTMVRSRTAPENAPPADQTPDPDFVGMDDEEQKKRGIRVEEAEGDETTVETGGTGVTHPKPSPSAKTNKETVNNESDENKDNPEAPPATRNPDPKLLEERAEAAAKRAQEKKAEKSAQSK